MAISNDNAAFRRRGRVRVSVRQKCSERVRCMRPTRRIRCNYVIDIARNSACNSASDTYIRVFPHLKYAGFNTNAPDV